jgi:hypothetical protein
MHVALLHIMTRPVWGSVKVAVIPDSGGTII